MVSGALPALMNIPRRKAVSPIIATLLLIAITVAAGIIVYVFVNGLAGNFTKSGGNQLTEQITETAYTFGLTTPNNLVVYLQNTGSGSVTLANFYLNGAAATETHVVGVSGTSCYSLPTSYQIQVGTTCYISFTVSSPTAGASYSLKVVTVDGGTFTFNVIAGGSG
jgi:flagellin-like protein